MPFPNRPLDAELTLRSFGEPVLVRRIGDREELVLDLGKPLALITYLACAPGRTASREHVVDLLWSDLDRDAALHGLRQALWNIRKRISDDFIAAERDSVRLAGKPWFDREEFLAAAECGDLDQVNALYTGDFFGHFATPGSGEFEHWADLERARLRSIFIRCIDRLARLRLGEGRAREAVDLARRIREVEPLHQAGWRLSIEALLAASDPLGAAVESDALERLLQQEEIEPEPSTRTLLAQARQVPALRDNQQASGGLVSELIGREREFAAILRAWRDARGGTAALVRVVAPAGLGKTRLVSDVAARIRAMRGRALVVRANPGARDVPYALASELAGALGALPGARAVSPQAARILVALNPRLSSFLAATEAPRAGPADELRQRMHAIHELIAAIADEEPLALFIDDLHWADALSRQALEGVFGLLKADRVVIVVAERGQTNPDTRFPAARFVPLLPLSLLSVSALVTSLAELPHERWTQRFLHTLHGSCGGSPLLVLETLHLLTQRGLLVRLERGWTAPDVAGLFRVLDEGGAIQVRVAHLGDDERLVLSILATAGVPSDQSTIEHATRLSPAVVDASVRALENQALLARVGERWQVAHDEIAGRVLDALSHDERRAHMAAVGRAVLADARDDAQRLRFSARYLQSAEDRVGLNEAFVRFVRAARTNHDRRPVATLAGDLLAGAANGSVVRSLVAGLSMRERLALAPPTRLATLAGALVMAVLAAAGYLSRSRPPVPPPNAVLAVAVQGARGLSIYETGLDTAGWTADSILRISTLGRPRWFYPIHSVAGLRPRPGHPGSWIANPAFSDSGAYDLVLLSPERGVERLTNAVGDDHAASWSPDGNQVVFSTGRWDPLQHYDLAILDLRTRQTRRLTSGDESDGGASWSPDGTRIAFLRKHWNGRAEEICIVHVDGSGLRCASAVVSGATIPDAEPDLLGWLHETALLVNGNRSDRFARVDATTLTPTDTFRLASGGGLAPNGLWYACACVNAPASRWTVFRVDRQPVGRPVVIEGADGQPWRTALFWGDPRMRSAFIERVRIVRGPGNPKVRVSHHLTVNATASDGRSVMSRSLAFASSDTTIATVDSLGTVTPRRVGTFTVTVSLGGWRQDTATLHVTENRVDTLLNERWAAGIERAWKSYGDPTPAIVPGRDGLPGLSNRGDGRFVSGVHSAHSYPAANGLAVDLLLSTPISLPQWQYQTVSSYIGLDSAALFAWDHRTGDAPVSVPSFATGYCEFSYASGPEGPSWSDSLAVAGERRSVLAAPKWMKSGAWYRVLIQVFPDGRCGIAVNGTAIFVSPPKPELLDAWVFLGGASVRTRILVGPLTIIRGVPADVDWSHVLPSASIPPLRTGALATPRHEQP